MVEYRPSDGVSPADCALRLLAIVDSSACLERHFSFSPTDAQGPSHSRESWEKWPFYSPCCEAC